MKFSYSIGNLTFFGFLIILLILPIFGRHKIGKFSDTKITTWYTALSHNLPTDGKSKVSSSNKCNKILGQSCRENVWTPNKSDPWGQNTPFCHDIRRAKTTILPVNNILMRFFAWNSFHLPRQFVYFVGNRLLTNDILRLAISVLFVSCRGRKHIETS